MNDCEILQIDKLYLFILGEYLVVEVVMHHPASLQ